MSGFRCRIETEVPQATLEEFMPELSLSAPGLPTEIALSYIRQAAIDIAQNGNVLRRKVRVDLQAGVANYLLEPPDCVRTIGISQVINGGRGLCVGEHRVVPDNTPMFVGFLDVPLTCCGAFPGTGNGFASGFGWAPPTARFNQPNELIIAPLPVCDGELGMEVELIVAPKRDACSVDRELFDRYAPGVVAGALMYLYRIPKQDWTDFALSRMMAQEFKVWTSRAAGDRLMGAARGPFRLTTPRIL